MLPNQSFTQSNRLPKRLKRKTLPTSHNRPPKISRVTQALIALGATAIVFSPNCGGKNPISQLVTHLAVKTSVINGDDWVQASATINTGGFQMAGVNAPITDPNTQVEYGQITLVPTLSSATQQSADLTISIDTTQISHLPNATATLPNGTALPVGGLSNATTIAIPIANTGAELYFAFGRGVALLGAAMSFSALDPAGKYGAGVDLFQPFAIGSIEVLAGIYGGALPNTTGVGVFMDLSSVINQSNAPGTPAPTASSGPSAPASPGSMVTLHELASSFGTEPQNNLVFQAIQPPFREMRRFYKELDRLQNAHVVLDLNQ
jgi:hypothetical protein